MRVPRAANASYMFPKEAQNEHVANQLAGPTDGIQEYNKVELVQPNQTHHPSTCIG